jgi:MFS family permease
LIASIISVIYRHGALNSSHPASRRIGKDRSLSASSSPTAERRSTLAATVGSIVEWYDFQLYGASAAVVFSKIFFTGSTPTHSVILAFLTFGAGFLARPFGGVIFGHFGDRIGRRPMLAATVILMSIATAAIGFLPTAAVFGPGVVFILIGLRCLQGLGAGAEYAGAVLLAAESNLPGRRGLAGSWAITGVWLGSLLALAVFTLCSSLPEKQFLGWGWRIPFLLNILIGAFGLWLRSHIPETPEFRKATSKGKLAAIPLVSVVRDEWRKLLVAMGANATLTFYSYILQVFCIHYLVAQIGMSATHAFAATAFAYLTAALLSPVWGLLCDRVGSLNVYMGGAIFSLLYVFPLFFLLDLHSTWVAAAAISIGLAMGLGSQFAAQASFLAALFPVEIRFTGIALSREVTGALLAGPAPAIATALIAIAGGHWWLLACAMAVSSIVVIIALLCAPRPQ